MQNDYLLVKTESGMVSVHYNELIGIVAFGRICYFILALQGNHKEHRIVYASHHMGHYIKQLEYPQLVKCHRSFVVNIDFVYSINRDKTLTMRVLIKDLFVVARRYRKQFLEKFKKKQLPAEI